MSGYTTILSFNGGGIRGLLSFQVLVRLVQAFPNLASTTSIFAGTSAGSSIAAHLANGGAVNEVVLAAQVAGMSAFYSNPGKDPSAPAYSSALVQAAAAAEFGTKPMSAVRPLVITAFQLTAGAPWQPVLFNNILPGGPQVPLADAVVASCTMPGMVGTFTSQTLGQSYVDGGFVDHDPSLAAIAIAVKSGVPLEQIALLDIGTGLMPQSIPAGVDTSNWGAQQWQTYNAPTYPPLLVNGTQSPVLNISLNGTSTGNTATLAGMLLGERFVSINPTLQGFIGENDVAGVPQLLAAGRQVDLTAATELIQTYWS